MNKLVEYFTIRSKGNNDIRIISCKNATNMQTYFENIEGASMYMKLDGPVISLPALFNCKF